MVFFIGFFPRKLEKKVYSNPTILNSKNFMIDIPLLSFPRGKTKTNDNQLLSRGAKVQGFESKSSPLEAKQVFPTSTSELTPNHCKSKQGSELSFYLSPGERQKLALRLLLSRGAKV